jgi:hypothetical protein
MENIEDIKLTDEDIRKMNLQVKQYYKKEDFIINNLQNKEYFFYICEIREFYLIIYKRNKNKHFKEFKILKGFFTYLNDYHLENKKILILDNYIKNQKRS